MSEPSFEKEIARINELLESDVNKPVQAWQGLVFGERVRVIEDDDDGGLCSGEEGWLVIERVGSPKFGSERICMSILMPGYDDGMEVDPDNIESV